MSFEYRADPINLHGPGLSTNDLIVFFNFEIIGNMGSGPEFGETGPVFVYII